MATAYTPGLRVTSNTTVRQSRRLPMKGEVLVQVGDAVGPEQVIARAAIPGNLHTIRASQILQLEPAEVAGVMIKRAGEEVAKDEVIAQTKGMFGLFRQELKSPVSGLIEEVNAVSGHVRIREQPRAVEISAHVTGRIVKVLESEGAVIETQGALVQGIFGIGGERRGELRFAADSPDAILTADAVPDCGGCVLVAGAGAQAEAVRKAAANGAVGLVLGALRDEIIKEYLGYDIGVVITGQEDVPMTIIVTEGFGELAMANRTWELLRSLEGKQASINGATQIRAGVIRPEIIVPHDNTATGAVSASAEIEQVLVVGSRVRVIRAPHFGRLGQVTALPSELTEIETESTVRIALVKLDSGDEVRVPRANLEIIL